MKTLLTLIFTIFIAGLAYAVTLETLDHKVIQDQRTYLRDKTDHRYSVWTDDPTKAAPLLKEFGLDAPDPQLKKGQVLAVFFNDQITEDLTAITHNKATKKTFADYADSGIEFKLAAPPAGKKYSHATAVVFTLVGSPSHLGLRGMVAGGLSEKR